MWIGIALVSGLASLAGYGLFQNASPDVVAFVLAFAAGAILTMLADTMMPEAFEHGGKLVGVVDHARIRGRVHHPYPRLSRPRRPLVAARSRRCLEGRWHHGRPVGSRRVAPR